MHPLGRIVALDDGFEDRDRTLAGNVQAARCCHVTGDEIGVLKQGQQSGQSVPQFKLMRDFPDLAHKADYTFQYRQAHSRLT